MNKGTISILLPALDEEETIGKVIDDIPRNFLKQKGYDVEVVVIDGHSRDRTIPIARAKGARILTQKGFGKGDAVNCAFKELNGRYLFMMDADSTYDPDYIKTMLPYLESGKYDVVLGSRFLGDIEDGAMPTVNYIGNRVLTSTANFLFPNGHKVSDVCTGMWGFNRKVVKNLDIDSKRFEVEAEIYAKCIKRGFRVGEVPVDYKKRETFAKLKSFRDGLRIWFRMLLEKVRH